MPTLKNKTTGEPVADMPYTDRGMQQAETVAQGNPNIEIDYAPGGSYDAGGRVQRKEFALGGAVGQAAGGAAASIKKPKEHCPTPHEASPATKPEDDPKPPEESYDYGDDVKPKPLPDPTDDTLDPRP